MKKLKIIIPVIIVIILAILGVAYYFLKDQIAFTGKAKTGLAIERSTSQVEVLSNISKKMLGANYSENNSKKPFEENVEFSLNADIENLEDLIGDKDSAKAVENLLKAIADAKITGKIAMDADNKVMIAEAGIDAEDLVGKLSGEMVITPDEIAIKSKEVNEKYIKVARDDFEDEESVQKAFEMIDNLFSNTNKFELTDDEIKHFDKVYGSILSDYFDDSRFASSKSEFTVDGKAKSCDRTTLIVKADDIKGIAKKYIEAYKNDKEGREIIKNKLSMLEDMDVEVSDIDEIDDAISNIEDGIDEIDGDYSIEINTYASIIRTYGLEIIIKVDEDNTINIKETFNSDNVEWLVTSGKTEYAKLTVKGSEEELNVEGKIYGLVDLSVVANPSKFNFKVGATNIADFEMSCDFDTKKDTDTEFVQDAKIKVAVSVPNANIDANAELKISESLKVIDSLKVPDMDDAYSAEDINDYLKDSSKNLEKISNKIQKSDLIDDISKLFSKKSSPSYSSIYDDDDFLTTTPSYSFDTETTSSNTDYESDIDFWYTFLDSEGTKTEAIESDMITKSDFDSDVSKVKTYTSWEKGAKEDKGYLGIEITGKDNKKVEYYVDISDGTVYDEDDTTFDASKIEWNEVK